MRAAPLFLPLISATLGIGLVFASIAAAASGREGEQQAGCLPDYPNICLPPAPPDLNCPDLIYSNIIVLTHPDPHDLDSDGDGIACEGNGQPPAPTLTPTSELAYRVFGIQVAKDQVSAPPTATPTPTIVATSTPTSPPASTATNMPPATATPTQTPVPTSAPTHVPTATATTAACSGATADIIGLDKGAEIVTLMGSGNLTGWKLTSVTGNQTFNFPSGFGASGTFTVHSGTPQFANTPSMLWWSGSHFWNNGSDDDAVLYNCLGQQVDYFDDGQ